MIEEKGVERAGDVAKVMNNGKIENLQVDNLYLDCNGIVHPCCHPEDGTPQPTTEDEMFENVGELVKNLVGATRPTNLLYLALDGVAPRVYAPHNSFLLFIIYVFNFGF